MPSSGWKSPFECLVLNSCELQPQNAYKIDPWCWVLTDQALRWIYTGRKLLALLELDGAITIEQKLCKFLFITEGNAKLYINFKGSNCA